MALIGEYGATLKVRKPPRAGTRVTLQVFGDNPGPGSRKRPARGRGDHVPDLVGYLFYRVEKGDTLTGIARKARDFGRTTVAQIVAANPQIEDPDLIQTGWKLRIPISS